MELGLAVIVLCCFSAIICEGAAIEGNSPMLRTARTTQEPETAADENYIEILRGRDGRDGRDGKDGEKGDIGPQGIPGPQGPRGLQGPSGGGVVYTRWGRTECPSISGTTLVYSGRMGGSWYDHTGGGANFLCLPEDPQYDTSYQPSHYVLLYGGEYQNMEGLHDHNVPCAMCHVTTRSSHLIIPAKTDCPSSWTREYHGYLVAEDPNHKNNKMFECVDSSPEALPGGVGNQNGALFYHVKATCTGLECPPYNTASVLTCALCTK